MRTRQLVEIWYNERQDKIKDGSDTHIEDDVFWERFAELANVEKSAPKRVGHKRVTPKEKWEYLYDEEYLKNSESMKISD